MRFKANKVSTTVSESRLGPIWNRNRWCFKKNNKNKTFLSFLSYNRVFLHPRILATKAKMTNNTHARTRLQHLSSAVNIWGALWGAAVAQTLMVTSEESVKVPQPEDVSVRLTKISIMRQLLQLKHNMRTLCVFVSLHLVRRLLLHGLKKRYSPFPPSPSPPSDRGVIYSSLCARSQWGGAAAY